MLFKPELATKVLAGEKTQTRRIKKEGERLLASILGVKMVLDYRARTKWQVGKTYAVQTGRGKPGIGRLRLLDIRAQQLKYISPQEAFDEGIRLEASPEETPEEFREAFFRLWDSISPPGLRLENDPEVWVLVFEVVN